MNLDLKSLQAAYDAANKDLGDGYEPGAMSAFIAASRQAMPLLIARVKELEEALRPFAAAYYNDNGDATISTGHLTRLDYEKASDTLTARAALTPKEKP